MKAKNTQGSDLFPNAKLLIVIVFVAIIVIFVKDALFEYYREKGNLRENGQTESNRPSDQGDASQTENPEPVHCSSLYLEIEAMIDEMNHCLDDSDCDLLMLGGEYVEFGCYHFINKNENAGVVLGKMDQYNKNCRKIINKCAPSPEAACVDGKCTAK